MGIKSLIMILASLTFSVSALADHHEGGEKKPFSIYGDFATSLNFYSGENQSNAAAFQNSFNNHDDFSVDLIEINIEKNWSKSKLHLSVGYGAIANQVNAVTVNSVNTLNVMNAYYETHTSYGLGFMIGKFESPVGHETYNYMDNSNYSRSYGFMLAPYFSTGLGLNYGQDMWKVGLIVSNGSGRDVDGRDDNKTMAVTVDVDPMENLMFDLRYVTGREGYSNSTFAALNTANIAIIDFSVSYMINEMFDVALNYIDHTQDQNITGQDANKATSIAAYFNANFGMFSLGVRHEQFTFDYLISAYNGLPVNTGTFNAANPDNTIGATTLTAKAEIDQNAQVLLEYRMEASDDQIWTDADGNADDAQSTITAGLMYRF